VEPACGSAATGGGAFSGVRELCSYGAARHALGEALHRAESTMIFSLA
jgi:hypothetical protein